MLEIGGDGDTEADGEIDSDGLIEKDNYLCPRLNSGFHSINTTLYP